MSTHLISFDKHVFAVYIIIVIELQRNIRDLKLASRINHRASYFPKYGTLSYDFRKTGLKNTGRLMSPMFHMYSKFNVSIVSMKSTTLVI